MHDDEGDSAPQSGPEPRVYNRFSLVAALIGVALLWPVPLAGVLLMVVASFAFVISWELNEGLVTPLPARSDPTPLI